MSLAESLRVRPGARVRLSRIPTDHTHGLSEGEQTDHRTRRLVESIGRHVHRLGADRRFAVLVVLQGMDTSGKDGTIRRVFEAVDPQLMRVATFRRPSEEELAHDFLWRIHAQTPRRGELVVFNRSHYEDVGIVRVHNLVPERLWRSRYDHINDFEQLLTECGTVVLKFFLHISRDEQRRRLEARLRDPAKNWKMDLGDLKERAHWDRYMEAFSAAISRCSTRLAPWHVIPSDRKWFRNHAVAVVVERALAGLRLQYPRPAFDPARIRVK